MSRFGELLRRERELRKITLREVSEATKINLRYLEMLERNDFRHLPGGVFNKGFVRAYAQYIGVDPEEMINAYLLEEREQRGEAAAPGGADVLRGARSAPSDGEGKEAAPGRAVRSRRTVLAVVLTLVLVAILIVVAVVLVRAWRGKADSSAAITVEEPARSDLATPPETAADAAAAPVEDEPAADGGDPGEPVEDATRDAATDADTSTAPDDGAATESPEPTAVPAPRRTDAGRQVAVVLARPTNGRIVCDRRVEILEGRTAGARWTLSCRAVLVLDADDGGAVLVGLDGREPAPAGPDGVAVRGLDLFRGTP